MCTWLALPSAGAVAMACNRSFNLAAMHFTSARLFALCKAYARWMCRTQRACFAWNFTPPSQSSRASNALCSGRLRGHTSIAMQTLDFSDKCPFLTRCPLKFSDRIFIASGKRHAVWHLRVIRHPQT